MKQRIVNIRDVARMTGVSPTTVSLVLNNSPVPSRETRARVLQVAKELNYQPDPMFRQAMQRRRAGLAHSHVATRTIGFFTSEEIFEKAQHDDGYYSRVHAGIQKAIEEHRYHLMWKSAKLDTLAIPEMVVENRVDGLLIEGTFPPVLRELLARRLPVTFIDRVYPELEANSVMPNIEQAVREILTYLWELGHRNIITFQHAVPSPHAERYLHAFHQFFARRNHPLPHPRLCAPQDINPETHWKVMEAYARKLVDADPRPTALVSGDLYSCGLMAELRKLGIRVPAEMSVVGLDDHGMASRSTPQLTSYRFDMDELGRSATELLIEQIQDRSRRMRHLLINGQIVERASCAPLKGISPVA